MPVPQEPDQWVSEPYQKQQLPSLDANMRRPSVESIRTEDCEGPIPDISIEDIPVEQERDGTVGNNGAALCSDRAELIERIKKGESPTWVPNQALKAEYLKTNNGESPDISPKSTVPNAPSPLLPAAEIKSITQRQPNLLQDRFSQPSEIQRPSTGFSPPIYVLSKRLSKWTFGDIANNALVHATLVFSRVCGYKTVQPAREATRILFYSWSAGNGRSASNDDPSPYVGHIDLQHSLAPPEKKESLAANREENGIEPQIEDGGFESNTANTTPGSGNSKKRKRTPPLSAPPGGSYRIPEQGQLQIIIKNPNKTAVKLFLVPYDLTGMESGSKTFVRQRSYSAEPVIDTPLASKPINDTASLSKKPTLRYLIHLNICSPSKGRFYLYQNIRVVFANRVPDNKEQLRNEIQVPQPRFSAYKPNRDSLPGSSSSVGVKLTAEKAYRRRSSGFAFGTNDFEDRAPHTFAGGSTFPFNSSQAISPIPAIPFNLTVSRQRPKDENRRGEDDAMDIDTSRPTTASDVQSSLSAKTNRFKDVQLSSSYRSNSSEGSDGYNKLSKGEYGYGGIFGRPGIPEPGEGLLAMRLKSLGMQRGAKPAEEEM
ncbi:hypothetical protein OEA41_007871 [Lepraria neglecta]|uniref:Atos-like C-terminal domain-containing protein n=1 Tax=Lepraria neglecta TaxID=209136 RepID=A0AAE0DNC3_9LECA|nr:hypothetical protein OEA41_007871 [Lepraria neglecta]